MKRKATQAFEAAAGQAIDLDTANVHPQSAQPGAIPAPQQQVPVSDAGPTPQTYGGYPHNTPNYDSYVPDPAHQTAVVPLSKEESREELTRAIAGSTAILVQSSTVPLLTLFPDTFSLDRAKLTITKRWFFRMAEVTSLRIEDVLSVSSTVGPFFGSVKIVGRVMNTEQAHEIGPFWRGDAEKIKRITHGYIIALQRRIDVSSLETKELAKMLDKLGCDDRS
ncbi:MAG: hypothetical protein QG629_698 [Patescibacteria group bacterium]|nr:hypothetical protein [Candidatus Saccharibacteria bacterium]MDQ5963615.1 hypothetical protein [Patescibacteria group bacterium]